MRVVHGAIAGAAPVTRVARTRRRGSAMDTSLALWRGACRRSREGTVRHLATDGRAAGLRLQAETDQHRESAVPDPWALDDALTDDGRTRATGWDATASMSAPTPQLARAITRAEC